MTRRGARVRAALAAGLAAGCLGAAGAGSVAHAAPVLSLGDARSQASALRSEVDRLQLQTEQASEAYDAAQEQLGQAVQDYVGAQERLQAAQAQSAEQRDAAAARVRALYESGGTVGLVATALTSGDVTEVFDRMEMARQVIDAASARVAAAGHEVDQLTTLQTRLATLAARRSMLQDAAATHAQDVTALLARQRDALSRANAQVKELVAAQQRAAAEAAARAFAARLAAARAAAASAATDVAGLAAQPAPAAMSTTAAAAIAAARSRLGVPYVWGATGPDAFDCSGLTSWAYAQAGVVLPRTAAEQWYAGPHIALANLQPGDLLFWATDTADPATIHHVALYIGNDLMIAAPHTGTVVQVQQVYLDGYIGAVRPTATAGP